MLIICEPQCSGFEHVEFNSALIALVRIAFPDQSVLFCAEEKHLAYVKANLEARSITGVEYEQIGIPNGQLVGYKRFMADYNLCRRIFDMALNIGAYKVIFSSTTSTNLIAIKKMLWVYGEIQSVVVPHQVLETITVRPSLRKPLDIPFWFRIALLYGNNSRLNYLLLSPSIERELATMLPSMKERLVSIHLPYFFNEPQEYLPFRDGIIRFGSIGVGHRSKGTDHFIELAYDINNMKRDFRSEFVIVGHIVDQAIDHLPKEAVVIPSAERPLDRKEFEELIQRLDYAVFLYRATHYRLTASAALFDAFSNLKPVIALRNPFFEYYFDKMGDIGYLCDSFADLKNVVVEVLNTKPTEKYMEQRRNLLKGRKMIQLHMLEKDVSSIWGTR